MQAILVGLGLQHKTVDELSTEIDLPSTQLLGLFNRTIRKVLEFMNRVSENHIHEQFLNFDVEKAMASMEPLSQSLEDEFKNAEKDLKKKQKVELEKLKGDDFSQFAIKGTDEVWSNALQTMELPAGSSITIKSGEKRLAEEDSGEKKKKRESPDGKKSFGKGWKKTGNKKKK